MIYLESLQKTYNKILTMPLNRSIVETALDRDSLTFLTGVSMKHLFKIKSR